MTIVFAAKLNDRNVLLADIFVDEGDHHSTVEKVFPCSWAADTFLAVLGDELFALILRDGLGDAPKKFGWAATSSLNLNSSHSMAVLAQMATDYRKHLRSHKVDLSQDSAAVYVVSRTAVLRWQFTAAADDTYRLVSTKPDVVPDGYGFVDAGLEFSPRYVGPQLAQADLAQMVESVDAWSDRLPYLVGGAVTGVVLPHDAAQKPATRCICDLTLEERTLKLRPQLP